MPLEGDNDFPGLEPPGGQAADGTSVSSETTPSEGASEEPSYFIRDLDEDTAYAALNKARHLDEHFETRLSPVQQQLAELQNQLKSFQARPSEPQVDVEAIKAALEKYDPGAVQAGVHEAIAQAIKFTPVSEDTISPYLSSVQQQIGDMPVGNQIVLSFYDPDEIAAIVPNADENGNPIPETQRHKDFLAWFDQQSPRTQQALQSFGPNYVKALKRFESWEQEQQANRTKAVGNKSQQLAGGVQPSANNRSGGATQKTAEDWFNEGFKEGL